MAALEHLAVAIERDYDAVSGRRSPEEEGLQHKEEDWTSVTLVDRGVGAVEAVCRSGLHAHPRTRLPLTWHITMIVMIVKLHRFAATVHWSVSCYTSSIPRSYRRMDCLPLNPAPPCSWMRPPSACLPPS